MSATFSKWTLAAAGLMAVVAAQTDPRNDPRNDPRGVTTPAQRDPMQDPAAPRDLTRERAHAAWSQHGDSILASWLLTANENEIALARLAAERAQSQEVKDFAQMMIRDHEPMVQKLRPIATAGGDVGALRDAALERAGHPAGADRPGTARDPAKEITGEQGREVAQGEAKLPAKTPERTTEDSPDRARTPAEVAGTDRDRTVDGRPAAPLTETGRPAGAFNVATVIRDLGRKCLDSTKQELSQKQGADFDRCYVKASAMAHQHALDMVQVFRRHASERLNPTLAEAERTTQAHLDHAKNLSKKIEGK